MSLAGNWTITNAWSGVDPYSFPAVFNDDGTITLKGFLGTWTVLGSSSQVSLAIGNASSITSYNGNFAGHAMGGQMTGTNTGGGASTGTWSAVQTPYANAPQSELKAPGK